MECKKNKIAFQMNAEHTRIRRHVCSCDLELDATTLIYECKVDEPAYQNELSGEGFHN